jgi:hypothetical protein
MPELKTENAKPNRPGQSATPRPPTRARLANCDISATLRALRTDGRQREKPKMQTENIAAAMSRHQATEFVLRNVTDSLTLPA